MNNSFYKQVSNIWKPPSPLKELWVLYINEHVKPEILKCAGKGDLSYEFDIGQKWFPLSILKY